MVHWQLRLAAVIAGACACATPRPAPSSPPPIASPRVGEPKPDDVMISARGPLREGELPGIAPRYAEAWTPLPAGPKPKIKLDGGRASVSAEGVAAGEILRALLGATGKPFIIVGAQGHVRVWARFERLPIEDAIAAIAASVAMREITGSDPRVLGDADEIERHEWERYAASLEIAPLVLRVVDCKAPDELVPVIEHVLLSAAGRVVADPRRGRVWVLDTSDRVDVIEHLIRALDSATEPAAFLVRRRRVHDFEPTGPLCPPDSVSPAQLDSTIGAALLAFARSADSDVVIGCGGARFTSFSPGNTGRQPAALSFGMAQLFPPATLGVEVLVRADLVDVAARRAEDRPAHDLLIVPVARAPERAAALLGAFHRGWVHALRDRGRVAVVVQDEDQARGALALIEAEESPQDIADSRPGYLGPRAVALMNLVEKLGTATGTSTVSGRAHP